MDGIAQLTAALAGRYVVEREIGRGGMATVYLARDVRHNRHVALKVLDPELGAVLGVERFLSEIQVTANLQHPNLLPLFDSGESQGLLFYVMPYVEGESLRARIDREKQLPVDEAVRFAVAIAGALDYAHRHGVIHRDLKPENILLHEDQPLIADFGIALAVSNAGGGRITQTGLSLGTPMYMSPEQATGDRVIDGRTDIYSLGAVLYEMLAGEPPHTGSTAQAIIARLLTERVRPVRDTRATVPVHVDMAVERALQKLPADRWHTASEFADALMGKGAVAAPLSVAASKRRTASQLPAATWITTTFAIVAVAALVVAWRATRAATGDAGGVMRFSISNQTAPRNSGTRSLGISPDGRTVLLLAAGDSGKTRLLARGLSDVHPRLLTTGDAVNSAIFSPDGKSVAFVSGLKLQKVEVSGGTPVTIADLSGTAYGATWLPNDQIVVSVDGVLTIVNANGSGTPRAFSQREAPGAPQIKRWPLAVDANTVLYTAWRASIGTERIGKVAVSTGQVTLFDLPGTSPLGIIDGYLIYVGTNGSAMAVRFDRKRQEPAGTPLRLADQIAIGPTGGGNAALSPNGTLVFESASALSQLMLMGGRTGGQVLSAEPQAYVYPRFSPDGKRIAVTVDAPGRADIWVYTLADGTLSRLTTGGTSNDRPEWTPDGKKIFYRSDRGGRSSLWWQPVDGSGSEQPLLQIPNADIWEGTLTPDSKTLVYRIGSINEADIWWRSLVGDSTPKPVANSRFTEWNPRFSADGHWLAYTSAESGRYQVYVRPFPGLGARYQVSTDGGQIPIWSRDGRRLYYANGRQLIAATLQFTPTFAVTSREPVLQGEYTSFNPGHAAYDVSPVDDRILLVTPVAGDAQTIVAVNWAAELRALLAKAGQ